MSSKLPASNIAKKDASARRALYWILEPSVACTATNVHVTIRDAVMKRVVLPYKRTAIDGKLRNVFDALGFCPCKHEKERDFNQKV